MIDVESINSFHAPDAAIEAKYEKLDLFVSEIRKNSCQVSNQPFDSLKSSCLSDIESLDPITQEFGEALQILASSIKPDNFFLNSAQPSLIQSVDNKIPIENEISNQISADHTAHNCVANRFEILGLIGRGSYGVVYRAFDRNTMREVALKRPRPELVAIGSVHDRFFVEGSAISKLVHPGIVPLLDMGIHQGVPYIVSRLVNGPNLEQWLEQAHEPIKPRLAALWIRQLSEAVDHLHQHGILHFDLKPSNILLEHPYAEDPAELPPELLSIRVTDFGSAAKLMTDSSLISRRVEGVLCFMAPEHLNNGAKLDARTDVYSICAVFYELLTNQPLFQSTDSETLENQILKAAPRPPQKIQPDIPLPLQLIVLKGLAKKPEERYSTAGELAADLDDWLNLRTPSILRKSLKYRLETWIWRNRSAAAFILILFMISIMIGSYQLQRSRSANQLEMERKRFNWWQEYVNSVIYAHKNMVANNQLEFVKALNLVKRRPPEIELKEDPREFAWRYLNHANRPVFSIVSGFPEKTPHYVMQISEKTKTLWAGGTDGFVREIEPDKSRVIRSIKIQENPVESLDISADGKFLAAGDEAGELRLFSLPELKIIDSRKIHTGEINDLKFSRDSQKIISTGKDGQLNIWNIESGKMQELFSPLKAGYSKFSSLYGISLLQEPHLVAVGTQTGAILIVDIQTLEIQRVYRGHHDSVYSIVLSTDWNWLVSVSQDYSICIWDLKKNILVNRINLKESGYTDLSLRDVGMKINKISTVIHLNHLNCIAVDSGNGIITLFHVPSGIKMGELRGNDLPAWSLAYLPWSKKVASFSRDMEMRIWNSPLTQNWSGDFFHFDLRLDELGREIPVVWYNSIAKDFSKNELEMINTVSAPFDYYLTDSIKCNSGQDLMTLQILPTTDFKMPAEHKIDYFFHASSDEMNRDPKSPKSIPVFRYSTTRRLADAKLISHPDKPLAAFISTDKVLHLIDYSDLEKPIVFEVASKVNHTVFIPESNQLLVLIDDGNPSHFYDYNERIWLDSWPSDNDNEWINASLSPDHSTLAVHRSSGRLQFWNFKERRLESEMVIPEVGRRRFREIQWLPGGQELVVSMGLKDIFLIDRKTGRVLLNWDLGNTRILKTHISADGESIWVFETRNSENSLPFFSRTITRIHAPKPADWKNN